MSNCENEEYDYITELKKYVYSIDNFKKKLNDIYESPNFQETEKILQTVRDGLAHANLDMLYTKELQKSFANIYSFNEQFKKAVLDRYSSMYKLVTEINDYKYLDMRNMQRLQKMVEDYNEKVDFNPLKIFDNFKQDNYNYIIFGKNGSGKTTLLNKLQHDFAMNNSIVAPATRHIGYNPNEFSYLKSQVNLETALNTREDNKTMSLLAMCLLNRELRERREQVPDSNVVTKKLIRIFDCLGTDRNVLIDENDEIFLYCDKDKQYSLKYASDGEKTILYFIIVTLLAPKNSFLFIDEPENHLNGSIMKKLFDELEKERKDIKFIYATNSISFIESRKESKLVYLEKTTNPNEWKFKDYKCYKDMPLQIILEIEGTNDDVIFCEGKEDSSYDQKLYSILFPSNQIVSVNGCDDVRNQTKIFNKYKKELRKKAYGIVDYDFRSATELASLEKQNVYTLKVNEIENVFLLECCLKKVMEVISNKMDINEVKCKIIKEISEKKSAIKQDFATKLFRTLHLNNKFTSIDNIEIELSQINKNNNELFINKYREFENKLENSIKSDDYISLMEIVPGKKILIPAVKVIGLTVEAFTNILFNAFVGDAQLVKTIRETIFYKNMNFLEINA